MPRRSRSRAPPAPCAICACISCTCFSILFMSIFIRLRVTSLPGVEGVLEERDDLLLRGRPSRSPSAPGSSAGPSPTANASVSRRPVTSCSTSARRCSVLRLLREVAVERGRTAGTRSRAALPASSTGFASRSIDAVGIDRSSSAGQDRLAPDVLELLDVELAPPPPARQGSVSRTACYGDRAGILVASRRMGSLPRPACSSCSSRSSSDSRERSACGRVTLTSASSSGQARVAALADVLDRDGEEVDQPQHLGLRRAGSPARAGARASPR